MKYAFLTLAFCFISNFTHAQFSEEKLIIADFRPSAFELNDIDNDGDSDIITYHNDGGGFAQHKVGWVENVGMGKFKSITLFENISLFIQDLKVADLNQDGFSDIIIASDNLMVLYGVGNGLFGEIEILQDFQTNNLTIIDLDGDSDLDIVARTGLELSWLENFGNGSFLTNFQLMIDDTSPDYKLIDFDNDGDQDAVVEHRVYENIDNEFEEYTILSLSFPEINNISIGDIDNNGYEDILLTTLNGVFAFKNENTVFSDVDTVINFPDDGWLLFLEDLDDDGDLDIVTSQGVSEGFNWHENIDSSDDFGEAQFLLNNTFISAAFEDMDSDGDNDIVTYDEHPIGIAWYEHTNDTVSFPEHHSILSNIKIPSAIDFADFDGDHDLDMVVVATDNISNGVFWIENLDGVGSYGTLTELANISNLSDVQVFDYDLDGDMDIFVGSLQDGISYLENLDGLGNFNSSVVINNYSYDFVFFKDIDGDLDTDIVSIHSNPHRIIWLENESGNFIEHTITNEIADYSQVVIEDYDSDEKMDIMVYKGSDNSLAWYKNLNNSFSEKEIIDSDWANIAKLKMVDLDNDGLKDLATATSTNEVAWYKNSGIPTSLGEKQIVASPNSDFDIQLSDFDNNGFVDFLVCGLGLNSSIIYFNNGDNFNESQIIPSYIGSSLNHFFTVADINNSGNQDVIIASYTELFWHENFFNYFQLQGTCFWDENENGNFDINETPLNNQLVTLSPFSSSWTNLNGEFVFGVFPGEYEISCQPSTYWELTTNSIENITISDNSVTQNFGLKLSQVISEANLTITSAPTRCDFLVPFWLNFQNTGTTQNSGLITLELDDLVEFQSANPAPSQINGNILIWNFADLNPTYSNQIYLDLQMPDVMNIGEDIELLANILLIDDNGNDVFSTDYQYLSTINCAYDPNDKQVTPPGVFDDNLTLFDEEFEYTIRFQNTGTDTAFTVRLEDQLDTDLNWSTFHPIAASHPYTVTLTDDGLLEFLFKNILLPDSTTNEIASHGFAKYRIQPLNDLEENTEIHNTANIFFDFNPPIQTNTTLNTMVSEITSTKEVLSAVEMDISPNPFDEKIQFNIGELPFASQAILSILDANGRVLTQFSVSSNSTVSFDGKTLPSGIYFYQLTMNGNNLHSGKLVKN